MKEYIYFTPNASDFKISLEEGNKCHINLGDEVVLLLIDDRNRFIEKCNWKLEDDNIDITMTFNGDGYQLRATAKYIDNSFLMEFELFDIDGSWHFDEHDIVGIKYTKLKDYNGALFPKGYTDFEIINVYKDNDKQEKYISVVGEIYNINSIVKVPSGTTYSVEGEIDFNHVGVYPIKINYLTQSGDTYSKKMVFSIVPAVSEQIKWYNEHYRTEYYASWNSAREDNQYFSYNDNIERLVCIDPYMLSDYLIKEKGL